MSGGSGSHCKTMSESPRQLNIPTLHVKKRVCCTYRFNNCGCAVPKRFHVHSQHFQSIGSCNILQNKVVTLSSGKFAVFSDTLNYFCVVHPVLRLRRMMCATVEIACVSTCVSCSQSRKFTWWRNHSCTCFGKKFCRRQLDPHQLAALLRHCAWTHAASETQRMILDTFAILQLVYMNFDNI